MVHEIWQFMVMQSPAAIAKVGEVKESAYLRLDQDQINEKNNIVMLNIFVGEALAIRTLCQSYTLAERSIIGLAVSCVEMR